VARIIGAGAGVVGIIGTARILLAVCFPRVFVAVPVLLVLLVLLIILIVTFVLIIVAHERLSWADPHTLHELF
jgi:hypothetical protein